MFRKIAISLLLLSFSAQTFSNTFFVAEYLLNMDKYARLCENKARPQLHCNGQCQVAKKIREEEKKEKEKPLQKVSKSEEVLGSQHDGPALPIPVHPFSSRKYQEPDITMPVQYSSSIFHPPSLI